MASSDEIQDELVQWLDGKSLHEMADEAEKMKAGPEQQKKVDKVRALRNFLQRHGVQAGPVVNPKLAERQILPRYKMPATPVELTIAQWLLTLAHRECSFNTAWSHLSLYADTKWPEIDLAHLKQEVAIAWLRYVPWGRQRARHLYGNLDAYGLDRTVADISAMALINVKLDYERITGTRLRINNKYQQAWITELKRMFAALEIEIPEVDEEGSEDEEMDEDDRLRL